MHRGLFATDKLLDTIPAIKNVYKPFIDSMKSGRLDLFDKHINDPDIQEQLISWSTLTIIERCRYITLRNLSKKLWLIENESTRLSFSVFKRSLTVSSCLDYDDALVECFLANLIDKGLIKGYLSHEKQTMVLGKAPFPVITESLNI